MLSKSTFRSAVALGVLAIVLSCASAVSAATSGGFTKKADAACAAAGARVEKLPRKITLAVIEQNDLIASALVRQLDGITPPAAQAAKFKTFIAQTKAQVTGTEAAIAAARKGQTAEAAKDLKKVAQEGKASNATARSLGLAACAKNYSPHGS